MNNIIIGNQMSIILSEVDQYLFREDKDEQEFRKSILDYADLFFQKSKEYSENTPNLNKNYDYIMMYLKFEEFDYTKKEIQIFTENAGLISYPKKYFDISGDNPESQMIRLKINPIDLTNLYIPKSKYITDFSQILLKIFDDCILVQIFDVTSEKTSIYRENEIFDIIPRTNSKNYIRYSSNEMFLRENKLLENYEYLKTLKEFAKRLQNNETKIFFASSDIVENMTVHNKADYHFIQNDIDHKLSFSKEFMLYVKKIDNKAILIYNSKSRNQMQPLFIFDIE